MNPVVSPTDPHESFLDTVRALLAAAADYLHARVRLLGAEAREAGAHFGWIGVWGAALAILGFIGYLLLVFAAIFGMAIWIGGPGGWAWSALGAALFHLALASACWILLRRKASQPVFPRTLDELKNDEQWLTRQTNR